MAYLLSADESSQQHLLPWVQDQQGLPVTQRMGIYANAYRSRLREVIDTDHDVLGLYLGDALFDRMVTGYIAVQHSPYRSLRHYCDQLPDFLTQDEFFSQYPVLADLALFERRLLTVFDAADSERATLEQLQSVAPERWPRMQLTFHPSVQLLTLTTNAVESWQALKQEQAPPAPEHNEDAPTRFWLLWRSRDRITEFVSLMPWQHRLMSGFIKGDNLAMQCEGLLTYFGADDVANQIFGALQAWIEMGIVRAFHPGAS